MRISRRDKYLLILLGFVLVFALYYFLLMQPQENKIKDLEADYSNWVSMKADVDMKIISERSIDRNIEDLTTTLNLATNDYYDQISQEDMLATLSGYAEGSPLSLTDMTFTSDISLTPGTVQYNATVGFNGDYDALLSYIRSVRNNEKKILVKEIAISNSMLDGLQGKLMLEFNALPQAAEFIADSGKLVSAKLNTRDVLAGPFIPYESFEVTKVQEPTDVIIYPEYPTDPTEVDYENYRPKTQIHGFEEGDNFFVANTTDISGTVSRSKTKIAGGYSAMVDFDFKTGREYSEASLVFDKSPIMLTKQVEYLGLWVYAYEASNHAIGVVLLDSKGKEYKLELVSDVSWTQWQELEVLMPVEITYPCMIQRIYVEGVGYDQKLTGKYLFDQLEVSYPLQ
ncbi:hypothetical protein QE109_14745 [Fusibacter bizertensis]|uniref:CBM11 domain-containing protein n=1 Tax=Fusibacter bizertensis TaxID=1488331 RepID=A0ABT6NG54_9FIRM|nr:hypothetical protein [Fusibacter bizertensis]MDH8679414.1 hypothetical protein [Fusibacter bizertensis]